jgi:hypothetical protein
MKKKLTCRESGCKEFPRTEHNQSNFIISLGNLDMNIILVALFSNFLELPVVAPPWNCESYKDCPHSIVSIFWDRGLNLLQIGKCCFYNRVVPQNSILLVYE